MATTLFSNFFYKLMILFVSLVYSVTPYTPPLTDTPIEGCEINDANATVVALADPQISNYLTKRYNPFDAVCEDLANAGEGVDSLLIAGDIAENGLLCEYQYVVDKLGNANVASFMTAAGNHDVRLKFSYKKTVEKLTKLNNTLNAKVGNEDFVIDALSYTYDVNGYTFIILGTDKTEFEESYFTDERLNWLDTELKKATADGKPAFVVCHQSLKDTHGLPDTWNSPIDAAGTVGNRSDELKAIMNKYDNVFFITGHLHTGLGQYTYEKIDNFHSINLPSTTINNKDGDYNDPGTGFMIEIYDNHVLFRARDFAKGIYIPSQNIDIAVI